MYSLFHVNCITWLELNMVVVKEETLKVEKLVK